MPPPTKLLRWLYLGRMSVAAGIFAGALLVWRQTTPEVTLFTTTLLLVTAGVTVASAWHTHVRERIPAARFLYGQVVYDALLVTAVVHLTGGWESEFAPLYVLVIVAGALMLPWPGGVLVAVLSSALYVGDILWFHEAAPPARVGVQVALFVVVAVVTGHVGARLRQTGTALGAVESELRRLQLGTDDILGAIDTGVVTVDGAGRLRYLNRAGERLLKLHARDWVGRPVLDELRQRAPDLTKLIARTVETGVPVRRAETRATIGRRDVVLGMRTTLLDRPPAVAGGRGDGADADGDASRPWVTAVFQDITDGKRVEELNRRAERLQAVTELAASLAHEIKNPLASIRSAVEQLVGDRLGAEDRELLQGLVVTESDRLSRLLAEFIEFSRVEVRRRAPVDLVKVARAAVDLVAQHPDGAAGPRVDLELPAEPVVVDGDEDLLHHVVFNLVLNAVQHTGADGEVRVELSVAPEPGLPPGVSVERPVRLEVRDTGPGIRREDLPRVFDPFFTTRDGGSGLGLALVHRAVGAHNGAIFVDGDAGPGTRFTVYLPSGAKVTV